MYIETKNPDKNFNGKIEVENRYLYTNLSQCKFEWKMVSFPIAAEKNTTPKVIQKGFAKSLFVMPGEKGMLTIPLPANSKADAFYLSAFDAKGDTVCTWSWPMNTPKNYADAIPSVFINSEPVTKEDVQSLAFTWDGITYLFDKATGYLQKVFNGKKDISFNGGPALAQSKGKFPRLEYSYTTEDSADFMGITFNYPEEKINGMKWMGRGPYHVWKNRLKGQQFGVWEKAYNNTVTGENWIYPEFKGWHSDLYWVKLQNKESDFVVYVHQPNIYLEMLQPQKPKAAGNNNTSPPFPEGNIGFMHAISAIGTKFNRPEVMGPQSQKNVRQRNAPLTGALYFDFR